MGAVNLRAAGRPRRAAPRTGVTHFRVTDSASLAVAQVEGTHHELSRGRSRFAFGPVTLTTGGTIGATSGALPSNVANNLGVFRIFNNEPLNGKTYYFEELGCGIGASLAPPGRGGMAWVGIYQRPAATSDNNTAGLWCGPALWEPHLIGIAAQASVSRKTLAIVQMGRSTLAASPTPLTWYPLTQNPANIIGSGGTTPLIANRSIEGRFSVPPQHGLAIWPQMVAGTTTWWAFAQWVELHDAYGETGT